MNNFKNIRVMVIFMFLVLILIIFVLTYMYCTERKIAGRYNAIASEFGKWFMDLQKECELMKSKIECIEKTLKK